MAASDNDSSAAPSQGVAPCLDAESLADRLDEEIARVGRHETALSCLLVDLQEARAIAAAHGWELSEQAIAYIGLALRRELRRFDRVGRLSENEYLAILPGADAPRSEVVARRALARLCAIKIEAAGQRRPLQVAIGIATWRAGLTARELILSARAATGRPAPEESSPPSFASSSLPTGPLGFPDALRL